MLAAVRKAYMRVGENLTLILPDGQTIVAEIKSVNKQQSATAPPSVSTQTLGEQVRDARKAAAISQKALAEELGMSVATINAIENDKPSSRGRNPGSIVAIKQRLNLL